jgi:tetratricopeptide (TPR) repeat protein
MNEPLRNIKVLPSDWGRREVVAYMRNVALGLGVRCEFCHQDDQANGQRGDFSNDDKATKRIAREMIRMVQAINTQTLPNLPERQTPPVEVACQTCHRGVAVPRPITDILAAAMTAAGADSAIRAYRALRERYYGRASYDFGDLPVNLLAQSMIRDRKLDEALALLRMNAEYWPQSSQVQTSMGEVFRAKGDTTAAVAAYQAALRLNPNDGGARQRLRELGRQP